MNEETKKRMEALFNAELKKAIMCCESCGIKFLESRLTFERGYTAAHNDAQGEIEKLRAENSKLKENVQWLELDIKDMRDLYLSNDSKLTLERAASAELVKYIEELEPSVLPSAHREKRRWILNAHYARQKEQG